jgi:hypothetical protein
MDDEQVPTEVEDCLDKGPQSALERSLIVEYLRSKGYEYKDIKNLPEELAKELMREACMHASLKLAEVESRAHFRQEIRAPTKPS